MANTSQTSEFFIGDLDVRVSTDLTKAGELSPSFSIGLLQDAKITMNTNQVKLQAGFPQRTYASVVTSRELMVSGSLNEYSMSNLAMIYGDNEALAAAVAATGKVTTTTAATVAGTTVDLAVADSTGFVVGNTVYLYNSADASDVYVAEVGAVDVNEITVTIPVPREFPIGTKVALVQSIELGSSDNAKELTIQVVGVMPLDGSPFVYDIWKGTISGSAEVSSSTQAFGALQFQIEPLQPSAQEIEAGKFGSSAVKKAVVSKFAQGRLTKNITM